MIYSTVFILASDFSKLYKYTTVYCMYFLARPFGHRWPFLRGRAPRRLRHGHQPRQRGSDRGSKVHKSPFGSGICSTGWGRCGIDWRWPFFTHVIRLGCTILSTFCLMINILWLSCIKERNISFYIFSGLSETKRDTAKMKLDESEAPREKITKQKPAVVKEAPKVN